MFFYIPYVRWQGHNYRQLLFQMWGSLDSETTYILLSSWGCKVCILWVIQDGLAQHRLSLRIHLTLGKLLAVTMKTS